MYFTSDKWYCVTAQPGRVGWAKVNLEAQIVDGVVDEVYVPAFVIDGRSIFLFFSYLFVRCDLDLGRWSRIRSTRGVREMLPRSREPIAVPVGMIDELRAWLAEEDAKFEEMMRPYVPRRDDVVVITSGPFANLEGPVRSVRKGAAEVEIVLFKRTTRVNVPCHRLRAIEGRTALAA